MKVSQYKAFNTKPNDKNYRFRYWVHFITFIAFQISVFTGKTSFDLDNIALMVTPTVIRPALVRCASARWRQIIQHRPSFNLPAGWRTSPFHQLLHQNHNQFYGNKKIILNCLIQSSLASVMDYLSSDSWEMTTFYTHTGHWMTSKSACSTNVHRTKCKHSPCIQWGPHFPHYVMLS